MSKNNYLNTLFSIGIAFVIGAIIIAIIGYNPFETYAELFKGAFGSPLNIGGTLERFVPIFLTALAFFVATKVSMFNVGVEGQMYLGAIAAAWVGFAFPDIPGIPHMLLCFGIAIAAGGIWALVPGFLKTKFKVNEICTTILLNYVAILITDYLVNGPLSAGTGISTTPTVSANVMLPGLIAPSRANAGIFIAIALFILIGWVLSRTTLGYRIRSTGANVEYSSYLGIKTNRLILFGMFLSGAIGGIAGGIQVLGVHHAFLNGFSSEIATYGMLAALIAKGDYKMIPIMAFFMAVLKNGALGMQRFTGIEASLIDVIIAIFILVSAMNWLVGLKREGRSGKRKTPESGKVAEV